MNAEEKDHLENEQIKGNKAQHSYEHFIKGFVEAKREILFESFRALPLSAETELMEIKRMLYAVDTLEQEIMTVIETGRMAGITLNKEVKH
jgi:hypothetical protein